MRMFKFNEIDSTNDFFKRKEDRENFDLAIAKTQTKGRGRRGNTWVSSSGIAMFSFLLKVDRDISMEEYLKLPLVTGLGVLKGLTSIENLDFKFKWTNDIYLNDKKLSGILVEKSNDFFIIGIGININNREMGSISHKATSLINETGKSYDLDMVIFAVLEEFKKEYERFYCGQWNKILDEINEKNYLKGKRIYLLNDNKKISGIGGDIASDGQLEVIVDGKREHFNIGEVHITKEQLGENIDER